MDEFRWSDLEEEARGSLDELLANIRSDVARESHEYPDDSDKRIDFEIRQLERADEWVRHAWQIYCDTLAGLGREVSDLSPIGWRTGILDFIDHRIEPLLETVFGVTDKDREFLRRGGITVAQLNGIAPHPLDKSTAWLKVEAAQQVTRMLKRKWKEMLPAPDVHGVTGERKTNSRLLSPYTQTHLDDLMRSFQGSQNTLGEFLTAQREEDRRKADLKAAAKTALRVGMEIARERSSAKTLANLTAPRTPEVPVVPQELPSSLTLAEIADYMDRAGWDPQKANELAAAELAVDFGNKVTSKHLRVFADVIVEAPEEDQPALHLQTVDLLARWLLHKREVVGPDDRVVVGVRSLGRAKKIAALWISDGLARRKTVKSEQTETLGPAKSHEGKAPGAFTPEGTGIARTPRGRPGRPPRLASDFVDFAGRLWRNNQWQNPDSGSNTKAGLKATDGQLSAIASSLDNEGYIPPADYLEKKCAEELKSYNSRNSNSKTGAIKTWSRLVFVADKDHLRGMRRLLSRCAKKVRSEPPGRVRK